MNQATMTDVLKEAIDQPFGTVFTETMMVANYKDGEWSTPELQEVKPIPMHPAAHVLHYGSACFEGMKAHRQDDGSVVIFRLDRHAQRMSNSAKGLYIPDPGADMVAKMISDAVAANKEWVPEPPGSLYIRPTLIGTLNSIGAAATPSTEAMFYILLSPVGAYFRTGVKPLNILIDDGHYRTSPETGFVKCQ